MLRYMAAPRIIGGRAKGAQLTTVKGKTRPTPSRLREALFDILAFKSKGTFLDLYSGTGVVGLEAASRDWNVTCVEVDETIARTIRLNARKLKLDISVTCADALSYVQENKFNPDVVFVDPPYELNLIEIFTNIESYLGMGVRIIALQFPSNLDISQCNWKQERHFEIRRYGSNSLALLH